MSACTMLAAKREKDNVVCITRFSDVSSFRQHWKKSCYYVVCVKSLVLVDAAMEARLRQLYFVVKPKLIQYTL